MLDPTQTPMFPATSYANTFPSNMDPALNTSPPITSSGIQPSAADVDEILKRKRKVREHKACYPCRQRKVKCDSNVPCKTCIERNHADICSFNPPPKRQDTGSTHRNSISGGAAVGGLPGLSGVNGNVTLDKDEWERLCGKISAMEKSFTELKDDLRHVIRARMAGEGSPSEGVKEESPPEPDGPKYVRAMEINEQSHLTGERVHLGGGSVAALVMALQKSKETQPAVQEVFGNSVLPLFGLDNESATYPFVDLWGYPKGNVERVHELCKALPNDSACLESFRLYRDFAHVTYPAIANMNRFETELLTFLNARRSSSTNNEYDNMTDTVYGMSIQWLGLLFAAFASGAQFSTRPKKERDPVSQVYSCCSFECLRLVNYISNASCEVVQTMLLLGNVLANGMNAGSAWSFLGMTIRLAQSLGLHRSSQVDNSSSSTPDSNDRTALWWAVLWQDSVLSLSYDRGSSAATADCPFPPTRDAIHGFTYHESMYRILKVGLDTIRNRVASQSIEARIDRCGGLRDEVQRAQDNSNEHLRDLSKCRSIMEQSEYWMLNLHASFMKSELCRPAISPSTAKFDQGNKLRHACIEWLIATVEAFLGVANVAPVYIRSWAVTHRGLSSALLLAILGEHIRNARVQTLIQNFIEIMNSNPNDNGAASELSAPIQRSVTALRKLSATESRTPRVMEDPATGAPMTADMPMPMASPEDLFAASTALMGFDESQFFIPNGGGFEDVNSPFQLADQILWGTNSGRHLA